MVLGLFKLGKELEWSRKIKEGYNISLWCHNPLCVGLASLIQVSFVALLLCQELHIEISLSQSSNI